MNDWTPEQISKSLLNSFILVLRVYISTQLLAHGRTHDVGSSLDVADRLLLACVKGLDLPEIPHA